MKETEEIAIPVGEEVSVSPVTPAEADTAGETDAADFDAVKDVRAYRVDEDTGSGFLGQMLSSVVWLLVGLLIGALGYYLFSTAFERAPDDTGTQTNQAVLVFEQQLRLVDSDPAKYISAYSTKDEKTAGDHYLVGRAYIIQGNYGAAKTSFENALKQLGTEDVTNRSILEHDIAAGLSIAINKVAQESFESAGDAPEDSEVNVTDSPKGD